METIAKIYVAGLIIYFLSLSLSWFSYKRIAEIGIAVSFLLMSVTVGMWFVKTFS